MSKRGFIALGIVCVGMFLVAAPLSAQEVKGSGTRRENDLKWREGSVESRLSHALVHGITG